MRLAVAVRRGGNQRRPGKYLVSSLHRLLSVVPHGECHFTERRRISAAQAHQFVLQQISNGNSRSTGSPGMQSWNVRLDPGITPSTSRVVESKQPPHHHLACADPKGEPYPSVASSTGKTAARGGTASTRRPRLHPHGLPAHPFLSRWRRRGKRAEAGDSRWRSR